MSEILYVPTRRRDGSGQVRLEMRTLPDGRLAMPAYTSLQELVRCCGPRQAWMGVDSAGLQEIHRTTGYHVDLLDARQPPPPPPDAAENEYLRSPNLLHDPIGRAGTR